MPSLALLQQSLEEWSREHDPDVPFRAFAVGSDPKLGRIATGDLTSVALEDLGAPATTDGATLANLIGDDDLVEGMTVIFSTYQSIQAVSDAQSLGVAAFDLVICDEAHRTTGVTLADEDTSEFVKIHDPAVIDAERRLYMTATPRIFNPEVKNKAREKDAELVSMDDESLFGPVVYRIGFGEAVERQLLTDYKVLVLGVNEDQIAGSFQTDLASEGHELPLSDVAKLIGCWNGMAKRQSGRLAEGFAADTAPMIRAVAFAKDIATSRKITHDFPHLASRLQDLLNDDATDDLGVNCRHVDGTMSATERGALLDWLKGAPGIDDRGAPEARILTNARCLSEGVDVPSLDAVLFLHARKSQVEVVQAVGRVMRRAEGKRCGYIILPIAIPHGVSAEAALSENERYRVVWQVLQALRSHDERLDAQINQMALTGKTPETVMIEHIDLAPAASPGQRRDIGAEESSQDRKQHESDALSDAWSTPALFGADQWKDAVYAKLVRTVGDRMYWDDWADNISTIAHTYIALIRAHLDAVTETGTTAAARAPFDRFVAALKATVNPEIDEIEAIELLAQHLVTMPIFEAMFPDESFAKANPVSASLQAVIDTFAENAAFAREREPLEDFYARVTDRIRRLPDFTSKQRLLVTLYDQFFTKAFPKLADRMGIVFTPIEVVDYILRSADHALEAAFGRRLGDRGIRIIDPFTGTGTFLTRLLQLGIIPPENMEYKYRHDLFANEIVLLSYYIAAVNIESVYREVLAASLPGRTERESDATTAFPGISLTDTFAMDERDNHLAGGVFPENTDRLEHQRHTPINVIVMNPPYSAGQKSANDDNRNAKYPRLDQRIRDTYAARSSARNKNGLYDSYYRALRWASDRIGDEGLVAFVSNSAFIDGNTADGVRLALAQEFSELIIYNLRGQLPLGVANEILQREGGNVFNVRVGIAITIAVKRRSTRPARLLYADVGDGLSRESKLDLLAREESIRGTSFREIVPHASGDWLNQRDTSFERYTPIGELASKSHDATPAVFRVFSRGLETSRDAWCYNLSRHAIAANTQRMIDNYNAVVRGTNTFARNDSTRVSWSSTLDAKERKGALLDFRPGHIRSAMYRPFFRSWAYVDKDLCHRTYQLPKLFPTPNHTNLAFYQVGKGTKVPFSVLMSDQLMDLHVTGPSSAGQIFPRWTWEPVEAADMALDLAGLDLEADPHACEVVIDGYRRVDNITDHALDLFRRVHSDATITKDDVFYAVYALLHHPEYRERYAADLTKMLPRIPLVEGFWEYARIGRALAQLHVGYEDVPPHPLTETWSLDAPEDAFDRYAIERMSWTKRSEHTAIKVNTHLTLTGIPERANAYRIGSRSPVEWVLDRYRLKIDKPSGIVNDPNTWMREEQNPRYVVELIGSLVTLSLETQRLIGELPALAVIEPSVGPEA